MENNIYYMNPEVPENERAEEQNEDRLNGGYEDKYYDENESRSGESTDLATGKAIKNDSSIKTSHAFIPVDKGNDLIKKELAQDPTTKWFLENGFDEYGNPVKKSA